MPSTDNTVMIGAPKTRPMTITGASSSAIANCMAGV